MLDLIAVLVAFALLGAAASAAVLRLREESQDDPCQEHRSALSGP